MAHIGTPWPDDLAAIGALRFARRSAHFDDTVCFYRDLVGLPLCATFEETGVEPVESHPYWAATGAVTYRDPDGRELVFAPFVFAGNEPADGGSSGAHSDFS